MGFQLALSGALPALFFMWYVDKVDAKRPEPRQVLRKVALFGGLSTIPCIIIELVLDKGFGINPKTVPGALETSFFSAALVEESAKAVCLYLAVWRHPAFDERLDGIVYATRAGLGFALVENVGYLLDAHTAGGFIGIYMARAFLAVPGHAIWAGFMGYYAARKRFDNLGPGLFGGLVLGILMHGSYDASLFTLGALPDTEKWMAIFLLPIPLIVVVGGYFWLRALGRQALRADDAAEAKAVAAAQQAAAARQVPRGFGFVLR